MVLRGSAGYSKCLQTPVIQHRGRAATTTAAATTTTTTQFRAGETTIKIKFSLFEGGGGAWGQRGKSSKTQFFFFFLGGGGERHDNKNLKVQILLSRNFVVIAQAPIKTKSLDFSQFLMPYRPPLYGIFCVFFVGGGGIWGVGVVRIIFIYCLALTLLHVFWGNPNGGLANGGLAQKAPIGPKKALSGEFLLPPRSCEVRRNRSQSAPKRPRCTAATTTIQNDI